LRGVGGAGWWHSFHPVEEVGLQLAGMNGVKSEGGESIGVSTPHPSKDHDGSRSMEVILSELLNVFRFSVKVPSVAFA
jgi:hypothetical protein